MSQEFETPELNFYEESFNLVIDNDNFPFSSSDGTNIKDFRFHSFKVLRIKEAKKI